MNRHPADGDQDVNPLNPVRFGLRDIDTKVDLDSVYTALSFGRAVYQPLVLPGDDPVLSSESISTLFSVFNDAAGAALPLNPADESIQTVGPDNVYRVERTAGTPQEGFRYIKDDFLGDHPISVEAKIDLSVTSISPTSYVTYADYVGVMLGLIVWPKNTGIFVFFRDDGFTKSVTVAGPSIDGLGTRSVEVTTVFDWGSDIYTYSICADYTTAREKVMVLASDSVGVETVLAEFDTTVLNDFLESVVLGNDEAEDPPNQVVLVVGTDGATPGDYIDIYSANLLRYGRSIVNVGGPTGSSILDVAATQHLLFRNESDVELWLEEGSGEVSAPSVGSPVELSRDPSLATAEVFRLHREEPDLSREEWMVIGQFSGQDQSHDGSYNTALGFDVEDGTNRFLFRLLDDFIDLYIGVHDSGNIGDTASYLLVSSFDWTEPFQVGLMGSASRAELRFFVDDDEVPQDTKAYSSTIASTETRLSFGLLDDDQEYYGQLNVFYLWVFLNCVFYEGSEATFPEVQGWTRVTSSPPRAISGNRLTIDSDSVGDYDIYYYEDTDYEEESGSVLLLKGKVDAWTDSSGAINPPRQEIGPIGFLEVTTVGVQLHFVESETGKRYVYFSSELSDVNDVLAQNEEGRRISHEINFGEDHVYMVLVQPRKWVRLYVDYSATPVVDVEWISRGLVDRTRPINLPASATVAFGSLGENSGVELDMAFSRASLGAGYDLSVQLDVSEDDLQDHVYGSQAKTLIDFEDVDP